MHEIEYYHEVLELNILNGETQDQDRVALPEGKCIGIAVEMAGTKPSVFVNLGLYDAAGNEIVKPHDWQFFQRTQGGPWIGTLHNFSFNCNRTVLFKALATAALAADFSLQIYVLIEQKPLTQ